MLRLAAIILVFSAPATCVNAAGAPSAGEEFKSTDTLAPGVELSEDAKACLDGLVWQPADFKVKCLEPREQQGDLKIQFPSPRPSGNSTNDTVTLEWYMARDEAKAPITAPAVVVVHESGSAMTVGRMFARGLRLHGIHTFMIQLPYYGDRRANGKRPTGEKLVPLIRQAVADVRRARDTVAALPLVEKDNISLQGTSLGGFVAATTAGLDDGFDQVFIVLAGGGLYDVIQNGEKDAAKFREALTKAGLTGDKLKAVIAAIEPTRIAHRIDPATTWLYTAKFDKVVAPENSRLLARTAKLDPSHHFEMLANHYSGVIYLPYLLTHIQQQIQPVPIEAIDE